MKAEGKRASAAVVVRDLHLRRNRSQREPC